MNTPLRAGQVLDSGFEVLEIVDLAELDALGIWARHRKSGAEVFHILNGDSENLFAFAFATPPQDSTGAAHILEHSVLCGSENYPLKDAFLVLAQGSLQTFLNAWTFPDKTLYPASSVNERDYFNLMAVYGDAVFRPLLSKWTFLQEGHRLVFTEPGQGRKLAITGVVYNEMKGAYSSLDAYAGLWSLKSVLPDTIYALESGGDPQRIPDLTWEGLRAFHRARYSPANCRIFLAGNIPTEKQLAFLNERFLAPLPAGEAAPRVTLAKPWEQPQTFRVPCPAGAERKGAVFLSWRCGDAADCHETIALAALTEALLGHDGSPLTRALIESGLGEDLAPCTGLEAEIRETVFSVGLRGVEAEAEGEDTGFKAEQIERLILDELRRLVREDIPPAEIEAALLSMEFANREIRRSGGPYSLVWMRRSLRGWLHGTTPWNGLLFMPAFTGLKRRLAEDRRFFEKLIEKYLLDNPHRALVTLEPEADYLQKQEAALAEELARMEGALSAGERRAIEEEAGALARFQSEGDSAEALAAIPHLSRRDLSGEIDRVPRDVYDAGGIPVLAHEIYANGISYGDFAFPLDTLTPEDYPWLPLYSRAAVSMGLPGMDYAEVSSLMARLTGGFYTALETGASLPGVSRAQACPSGVLDITGRDWMVYRLKALDEKNAGAMDLALRLVLEADFSDHRRLRDLVLEMKNELDASLAPSGHYYAASRAGRMFSRSRTLDEVWNGLEQLRFIHAVAEYEIAEIAARLCALRDRIAAGGLIANITGSAASVKAGAAYIGSAWSRFGPPRPRNPACEDAAAFSAVMRLAPANTGGAAEVYASPSLQVGFAALVLPGASFTSREHAAEIALAHELSTGALWERIRMKGGAYGAFAQGDGVERLFSLSTYRDPDPLASLEALGAVLQERAQQDSDGESLEKAIIGCYAKETRPRTPVERGFGDFCRFLHGIDNGHRERRLRALTGVSGEELAEAARRLASSLPAPLPVIIAGTAAADRAAAQLGVRVMELPA
ncbi:MAG: insulinase family protein [Treponema sp.]|jgi:Zn-dependent M16 (insulinase) family peptidase|nr:insulinase family protein [Treponema sp.]